MNNYQIYEEIGRGRHSKVYKGRLKKSVEYYAIKSVEKTQRGRVLNEVTMLHQLNHENILRFFHWYETNNHLWLIEEYCTGSDLLTLIKQDTAMPEETLVTFASDLLSALNFIHSKGILYCDLKPSNVLIDAHGFLKLSDFGLACHIDEVKPEKRKIGTPSYMAPELFQHGGVLSFASDLWSLGVVLYEIYTGKPPFVDQKLDGLIERIVYDDYLRPIGCSRGFLEVLEGLLERDPLERLDWTDLPNHEFWKDKEVVYVTTQQPAFEGYRARRAAEGTVKSSKEAREAKERRRQQVARISATAQQNLDREQLGSNYTYGDDKKAEPRLETDAEVDFGNIQHDEDEAQDDAEAPKAPGGRSTPTPGGSAEPEQQQQPAEADGKEQRAASGARGGASPAPALPPRPGSANVAPAVAGAPPGAAPPAETFGRKPSSAPTNPTGGEKRQSAVFASARSDGARGGGAGDASQPPPASVTPSNGRRGSGGQQQQQQAGKPSRRSSSGSTQQDPTSPPPYPTPGGPKGDGPAPAAGPASGGVLQSGASGEVSTSGAADAAPGGDGSGGGAAERAIRTGDVDALLFHPTDTHVKPIMCNTRVERLPEVKFDAETLSFPAHTLHEVCQMETAKLEGFLTAIYKAIGGKTTIGEKQNTLCYFETLCGATATANLFINSLLMTLFIKMVHNDSYPPGLKARLCLVMGLLIRHATFINNDLAKTGIVEHLVALLDDKNVKVTRRAVACLGELLFYIATQHKPDRDSWNVNAETIRTFTGTLNFEDEVVRHYAVKTIENITGHGDVEYTAPYATRELICALLYNFHSGESVLPPPEGAEGGAPKSSRNDYLRSSAISGASRICRTHHSTVLFVLEEVGTTGLIQSLVTGSNTRTLQSCLNLLNLLLAKALLAISRAPSEASPGQDEFSTMGLVSFMDFSVPSDGAAGESASPKAAQEAPPQGGGDAASQAPPPAGGAVDAMRASVDATKGEHIFESVIMSVSESRRLLAELRTNAASVIHALTASLEHSSSVVRAKTLLAFCLLIVVDLKYLALSCEGKLTTLLERISKESDRHVSACFATFCQLVSSAAILVTRRLHGSLTRQAGGGGAAGPAGGGAKEMLGVVLHVLTTPCMRSALISRKLIDNVSECLRLASEVAPAPGGAGEAGVLQQLLLIAEVVSQDSCAVQRHYSHVVTKLLPVLAALLESSNGGTRFMSLKIFIDLLAPLQEAHQLQQQQQQQGGAAAGAACGSGEEGRAEPLPQLVLQQLFPKLMKLLDDEEPIPLYGLKLLNSIATENPFYVTELSKPHWVEKLFEFFELEHRNNNVHNVKLVLKIVTCSAVPLRRVFELGVVAKLNSVLSYAYLNSVESFFESCLDICLSLLEGTAKAQREYQEGGQNKEDYIYALKQCAQLVNNVELYAKLATSSDAADTASVCLMLSAQLYCNCDFPGVIGDLRLRESLLSDSVRSLLRACLTEHCNKTDTLSLKVTHCMLRTVLAAIPLPSDNQADTASREAHLRRLRDDELLVACIREAAQQQGSSSNEVNATQQLAASLLDILFDKGCAQAEAAEPPADGAKQVEAPPPAGPSAPPGGGEAAGK